MQPCELKFAPERDGEIVGYASLFNGPADAVGDIIAPGAFTASLKAGLPRMLREHRGEPVGEWLDVAEDDIGLKVRGTVTDPATLADLRAGRLDGLSIGYAATRATPIPGGRRLEEIRLDEVSLVKRPASSRARVLSVKSHPAAAAASLESKAMEETTAGGGNPTVEDRVGKLETSVADIDKRLKTIEGNTATQTKSLDRIETMLRRPGAAVATEQKSEDGDMAAFTRFLRYGPDALDLTERKSLRLADDVEAGYLAVPEFVTQIDKAITLFSPIRSVATVRRTTASEVHALRRTTAPTAVWVDEEEDRSESNIQYGKDNFPVRELATYVDVSNQLLEDASVDIAAEIALEFAEAFGAAEATAFVTGDGVKRPLGFMSHTGLDFTVSGAASAITADGLIQLMHDLKPAYRANGTWAMSSATLAAVRKLKAGDGHYLVTTAQGMAGAPATTLLGRPIIECPDMPSVGAGAFPIAFGDFRLGFTIYDRIALSIVRDPFTQATKGRTRFHGRRRLAAGVRRPEAIRRLKIST